MGGLRNICKAYGGMKFTDANGKTTEYEWDYAKDEPRLKGEMTREEWAASERAKWGNLKALTRKPPPKKKNIGDSENSLNLGL
jgi:hypothetical protein